MAFDWKQIVRTVAPTIASAIGGPLAGTATQMVSRALLGRPDAPEEEIEAALLQATPADLLKLKQMEKEFKLEMKQLGIRQDELVYKDIADARAMAERTSYTPQAILTGCFIVGYFSMVIYVLTMLTSDVASLNPAILSLVSTLIGVVTAEIPKSMQFWFGSSKGSKDKTAALNSAMTEAVRQAQEAQVRPRVTPVVPAAALVPSAAAPPATQPPAPVSSARPSTKPTWM